MRIKKQCSKLTILAGGLAAGVGLLLAQDKVPSSYAPVDIHEAFASIMARMSAAKPDIMKRQMTLIEERYDLSDRPVPGVTMSRNKPVQQGVRVKLAAGVTWDQLAKLTPEQIKDRDIFPAGFLPLPHPNHPEGGMLFPKPEIEEMKKQENRDLTRFDLDFDTPDQFLPEFPPMYLTTRPDLGDVSKGKLVTLDNYYDLFNGILNPKQIDGLCPTAVQPDRGSAHRQSQPRCSLPRLPRQRPHQSRHAPGGRHPAAGVPAPHQYAVPARRKHPAPVRFPARSEDSRGLYGV
jgi:cytochrome c peroxidase